MLIVSTQDFDSGAITWPGGVKLDLPPSLVPYMQHWWEPCAENVNQTWATYANKRYAACNSLTGVIHVSINKVGAEENTQCEFLKFPGSEVQSCSCPSKMYNFPHLPIEYLCTSCLSLTSDLTEAPSTERGDL